MPSQPSASHSESLDSSSARIRSITDQASFGAQRLEHAIAPLVTFAILPVFALANAGVSFAGVRPESLAEGISLGILLGLVVGKPAGIVLFSWFAVRAGLGALPSGVRMSHVLGIGMLGGIGFTMALFVGDLAFANDEDLAAAKLGILTASTLAALLGLGVLARSGAADAGPSLAA